MKQAMMLLAGMSLAAGLALAQTSAYPPPTQTPAAPPAQTAPQNPTNPASQMPPDSTAAPPSAMPQPGAPPQQEAQPVFGARQPSDYSGQQVPAGTEIHATLDTPLSTKTSHVGDQFTATVAQPVQGRNGVAIPAGTKIHGEVVASEEGKALPQVRGRGRLNLRFRDMTMPSGVSAPLTATLVSVNETKGGTAGKTTQEGEVQSETKGSTTAKDVGIGAGIGTVAGLILGHPLRGLAIGAIAGGGYVLATKGKDVNLPAESGLVLRLDSPMSVPAR